MKIRDVIQEFIPCEVCGNSDIRHFYFHVFVHWGSQPYVKCCQCEEEYYSTTARAVITKAEDARKAKKRAGTSTHEKDRSNREKHKYVHPLLKTLSQI